MKIISSGKSNGTNIFLLFFIGICLTFLAAWIIIFDPVKLITDKQLSLRPGTLLHKLWLKPPLDVFIMVYMFNVTNFEAFKKGIDPKLKINEIGPYVYQEILENHNVTFNGNSSVTFTPKRSVKFIRERSVGDPKVDKIIAPNIPYMGVTSAASSFSAFAALAVSALTKKLNTKAMLYVTVHEYLWGYDDHLVYLASKIIPNIISFQKFGLLERMFDEGDNVVTMKLPKTQKSEEINQLFREYSIEYWNGKKSIQFWDHDKRISNCNALNGTYDGTLFPRNIKMGETFRVYRKAFCRSLPITFSHSGVFDGIEGYHFKLPNNAFDSFIKDPNTSCFCKHNKCLKKGLGNITPCYYNIPLAISFPHFMHSDESLLKAIDGLHPNESRHSTEIIIQPQLGIPMKVHTRFQINLLMGEIKFNKAMNKFENTVLPIFWLDLGVDELPGNLILLLKVLFKIGPYLQLGVTIGSIFVGISMIAISMLFLCSTSPIKRNAIDRITRKVLLSNVNGKVFQENCTPEDMKLISAKRTKTIKV